MSRMREQPLPVAEMRAEGPDVPDGLVGRPHGMGPVEPAGRTPTWVWRRAPVR